MSPLISPKPDLKTFSTQQPLGDFVLAVVLIAIFAVLTAAGVAMTSRLDRRRHELVQARREDERPQR